MDWFDGLTFGSAQHVPDCRAWIDRSFDDYCALNFARAGRIAYARGGAEPVVLPAPLAWWTVPGVRYTYGRVDGRGWDHYYVTFRGPRVGQWERGGLWHTELPQLAPLHQSEPFTAEFAALVAALDARPVHNPAAVARLEQLLLQLREQVPPAAAVPQVERHVRALLERIRRQPAAALDLAAEASAAAVSPSHFRRVFTRVVGAPPHACLLQARLDEAARLLRTSASPLKEVAARVGCADVYHFNKLFRQRYGVPPGAYRQACPENGPTRATSSENCMYQSR